MDKFQRAARKAVATFLFAALGTVAMNEPLDMDVANWKLAAATGLGAVANLVYRWAESARNE